ncbi:hypothetical protein GLGR_3359 [Leminorella grimontii ATCC 33999 = DSM 5078]|nr:hypothetical protein GLGR_3359 [Leminorella grimontii ATCC 33999 = DSM 5078]
MMSTKNYVILDTNPRSNQNDDFILLGLKNQGFARGCPMLFGGTADAKKDGRPDEKDFALKVIRREVREETGNRIIVNQIGKRIHCAAGEDISVYTSHDFHFDGRVNLGTAGEFAWIRKVSKGKLSALFEGEEIKNCEQFGRHLFGMTLDESIDPTYEQYHDEYLPSESLKALYKYCLALFS